MAIVDRFRDAIAVPVKSWIRMKLSGFQRKLIHHLVPSWIAGFGALSLVSCLSVSKFTQLFLFSAREQIKKCLQSLDSEKLHLCNRVAETSLSSMRLRRRLIILHRYFTAFHRQLPSEIEKTAPVKASAPTNVKQKEGCVSCWLKSVLWFWYF